MLVRSPGLSTSLLGLLLLFEAFVYASARWASAAAEKVAMTPARQEFMRSAQNTGDRPSRAPMLTAVGAGGVAAALIATGKHFPGRGDSAVDVHFATDVNHASRKRLEKLELAPYRELIAAGLNRVLPSGPSDETEPGTSRASPSA